MQTQEQLEIKVCSQDWVGAFKAHLRDQEKSENTLAAYRSDLQAYSEWFAAEYRQAFEPEQLTAWDVRRYKKLLLDEKFTAATVNRRLATLKSLGDWAFSAGLLASNPLVEIRSVAAQRLAPRWIDRSDFGKLMRQLERDVNAAQTETQALLALRDRAAVLLMAYAGLRVAEVCGLQAEDIQLSERKGLARVCGKGDKLRTVPLVAELRKALGDWLQANPVQSGTIWSGKHGPGLDPRTVQRRLKEICRQAGIEATPHQLRHTCAKRMVESGVDITVIAAILGHERISTTVRYLTPGIQDMERALEKI